MLSSVQRSERALEVNIAIIHAFLQLREMLTTNVGFARKLKQMKKKLNELQTRRMELEEQIGK